MRKKVVLMLFLLLGLTMSASAQSNDDVRLTISFSNESLPQAFLRLEQSSQYKFLFTYDDVNKYTANGNLHDAKFFEIVDYILKGTPLEYHVDGKFINVTLKSKVGGQSDSKKQYTTGGYVVDEQDEPVVGAQVKVLVPGSPIVTMTDLNGAFSFDYSFGGDMKVQVSYVGMKTVTLPLSKNMRIKMQTDNMVIKDVVVTGIFRKAKESYTGAITSIDKEQLQMFKGQNLLQTLKNIDASLSFAVNNIAGSNPNTLPQINIRGNASLPVNVQEFNETQQNSTNTPLIIMDGFEISLTKLMDYNDDEIESINILKDASATAIYGSRGANGVIVVVSKRPEMGKLKVNLELGTQLEIPDLSSYHLLNAAEKLKLEYDAGLYDTPGRPATQLSYREAYNNRLRTVLSGVNTDWLKKPVHTGVGQLYKARIEGGNEEFRWGASLGYNDVEGAMKGSSRKTFNGSVTLMYTLDKLIFRNYLSFGVTRAKESQYGSFSDYAEQQPYDNPYDENGKLVRYFDSFIPGGQSTQNPLYDAMLNTFDKNGYDELINNFSVEWNILPELTLRGKLGISTNNNTSDYFLPAEHSYFTENPIYSTEDGFLRRGFYRYGTGKTNSYEGNVTLAYNKIFNDVHMLYAGVDYALTESSTLLRNFEAEGFTSEDLSDIINARQYTQDGQPYGSNTTRRRLGLTANINYTFDNRYYADLSYRIDGSSEYGSDKKYAPFYSIGLGWNLHNEKFMKDKTPVNMLKIRGSYGETGSQLSSNSGAITSYHYVTDNKYMNWTGAVLNGLGNSRLTWQTTKEFNIGVDFGVWDNRIKGSFDWYKKNTSNLLSYMNLPLSMGFSSYADNVGEVSNQGFEISLSAYLMRDRSREINWIVSGQLVYNENKIEKLSDAIKAQNEEYMNQGADVDNLFFEGYPQNAIYAVRSLGVDPSTGNEVFLDKNGNITDTWNASDKVFLGSSVPLYQGNFSSTFIWKKLTFTMGFRYYWGGYTYNSTLRDKVEVTLNTIQNQNVDSRVLSDRWFEPGDVTFFKKLSNTPTRATSRYVMKDDVLELSSISIMYRWDTEKIRNFLHCNSIVFGINMSDLFHWSSIKMERGTSYPYARNIQGSVKFSF